MLGQRFAKISIRLATKLYTLGRHYPWYTMFLLVLLCSVTGGFYIALSIYIASQLVYAEQKVPEGTPAELGLCFRDITFTSRVDKVLLQGWFIPGILPSGGLTVDRTIIVVHGVRANREDRDAGVFELCAALAHRGFAVLTFDMRGAGNSAPAPLTLGYFEQRDVLGAVDFLYSDQFPYSEIGHPRTIGGWGVSMGGATLLLAASQEPAIDAIVSDSAYAEIVPILEREIPKVSHLPSLFIPGILVAARVLYKVNFYKVSPMEVVARIAPRPILFIHGGADHYILPSNMDQLAKAARIVPNSHVQTWLLNEVDHAQAFHISGSIYLSRIIDFFTAALGPDMKAL